MTPIPPVVEDYLRLVEGGEPRVCREQIALAAMIRRVFAEEDLIVETERLAKYLSLDKYFPYALYPWEKFLTALWLCTYSAPGVPRWKMVFCMVGRGAGKDGYIAFVSFAAVSPYNPVPLYDVDICANDEEQAMRPLGDVVEVLELGRQEARLKKHYYHTKEVVQGRRNRGRIKGRTNNPKHRDGMRSGMIVFNEVHAFENYDNITVFTGGLGKKPEPREGIFSSDGNVNDGPLDDYISQSMQILFEGMPDGGMLPFISRLPSEELVHDERNWYMANPSLQYRPALLQEIRDEYERWKRNPEQLGELLTKRMGIRRGYKDMAVADYERIRATNRPLPELAGRSCTVGIDYAELSDWAAVDLHFREGDERYDICHAWLCARSKTLPRVKAPWRAWAEMGILTVVEDVSISPALLADYIAAAGAVYNIRMLAMDHFRWTLVAEAFRAAGFDASDKSRVKLVRPSDIMQAAPVIDECFARDRFVWGDNPALRWAASNTKKVRSSRSVGSDTGNYYYAKIDAKARKTDMFMALVAAMTVEPMLGSGRAPELPPLGAIAL